MKLKEVFTAVFLNPQVKLEAIKKALPCTVLELHDSEITVILVMTSILRAASSWQRALHPCCGAGMANIWVSSHTLPQTPITKSTSLHKLGRAAH